MSLKSAFSIGLAVSLLVAPFTGAHAADPVGHFAVKGNNPGGGDAYEGEVTVTKTGDTYKVVWTIEGTKYIGTGIGNDDFLTVSYKSGSETGLALYGHDKTGWSGIWTYAGGKTLGVEKWTAE